MQPSGEAPLPTVSGLVVCEQIIVDQETKYPSLINCFSHKKLGQYPSEPLRFAAMAFLTTFVGDLEIVIVVRRLDTFDELFRSNGVVHSTDRLSVTRVFARFRLSIPIAGAYDVSLETRGDVLAQRRLLFS